MNDENTAFLFLVSDQGIWIIQHFFLHFHNINQQTNILQQPTNINPSPQPSHMYKHNLKGKIKHSNGDLSNTENII